MTLSERQDKERNNLINRICEMSEDITLLSAIKIMAVACALKWVTTNPEAYFENLDKKE